MATNQGLTFAFIVSLIGGLIVLIVSLLNFVWFLSGAQNFGGYGSYMRGGTDGYHGFMGTYGSSSNFLAGICCGLISGVIMLIGAIMLKVDPHQSKLWAILIIVFSVISFVGMGGYFIGAILGIIGGVFVFAIRQTNT